MGARAAVCVGAACAAARGEEATCAIALAAGDVSGDAAAPEALSAVGAGAAAGRGLDATAVGRGFVLVGALAAVEAAALGDSGSAAWSSETTSGTGARTSGAGTGEAAALAMGAWVIGGFVVTSGAETAAGGGAATDSAGGAEATSTVMLAVGAWADAGV